MDATFNWVGLIPLWVFKGLTLTQSLTCFVFFEQHCSKKVPSWRATKTCWIFTNLIFKLVSYPQGNLEHSVWFQQDLWLDLGPMSVLHSPFSVLLGWAAHLKGIVRTCHKGSFLSLYFFKSNTFMFLPSRCKTMGLLLAISLLLLALVTVSTIEISLSKRQGNVATAVQTKWHCTMSKKELK